MSDKNIFPIFNDLLKKSDKEKLLKQKALTIWMTGLSGSGKSTIAKGIERILHNEGYLTQTLDGDNVRSGINNNLTFSLKDRKENIRRIAEISKLFVNCGIITINCFVSPTIEMRDTAKKIIGEKNFLEVYINASLEKCIKRDTKGLYAKAKIGQIKNFTGIDSPYEAPIKPDIEINTNKLTIDDSLMKIINYIKPKIKCQ